MLTEFYFETLTLINVNLVSLVMLCVYILQTWYWILLILNVQLLILNLCLTVSQN